MSDTSNNRSLLASVHSSFPMLEGSENFGKWKKAIQSLLVGHLKYNVVETVEDPHTSASVRRQARQADSETSTATVGEGTPTPAKKEEVTISPADRANVWGLLFGTLQDHISGHLSLEAVDPIANDARLLWKELHLAFNKTDGLSAGLLNAELWNTHLHHNGHAVNHLLKLRDVYRQLTAAGEEPNDRMLAQAMLQSLPPQYSTVRTTIFARESFTSINVFEAVQTEWKQIGSPAEDAPTKDSETAKAFVAAAKPKSSKSARPARHCDYHPDATSHNTSDCHLAAKKKYDDLAKKYDELLSKMSGRSTAAIASTAELDEEDGAYYNGCVAVHVGLVGHTEDDTSYVIDSGASAHMVCTPKNLSDWKETSGHPIRVGGNNFVNATHTATLKIGSMVLPGVLYAPDLGFNLLSVHKLGTAGYDTNFESGRCIIKDKQGDVVLDIPGDGLYTIKASSMSTSLVAQVSSADDILYLHRSLGHLNWMDVWKLAKSGCLGSEWENLPSPKELNILCEPCILGKGTRLSSPPSLVRAVRANQFSHVDLWGATKHKSWGGSTYFLTCYDDYSHYIQIYFLKSKDEALGAFQKYLKLVENQCKTKVERVRMDNGGEFTSEAFQELLATHGIEANPVPAGAHAQNGRVERVHLTLLNMVRTILADTGLPKQFWAEMAGYAAYIRNRVPRQSDGKTPRELWSGQVPNYSQLRPFGSTVFVRDHVVTDKLEPRYLKAFLVGYRSYSESVVRFFNPVTKKFNYSRDYVFERKTISDPPTIPEIPKVAYDAKAKSRSPIARFPPISAARPVPPAITTSEPSFSTVPRTAGWPGSDPVEPPCDDAVGEAGEGEVDVAESEADEPAAPIEKTSEEILAALPPKKDSKFTKWVGTTEETGTSLADLDRPTHIITEDGRRIQPRRQVPTKNPSSNTTGTVAIRADANGETGLLAILSFELDLLQSAPKGHNLKTHQFALTAQTTAALEVFALLASDCPKSYRQARNSPEWPKWEKAMKVELAKMEKYDVWELVLRSDDMRVLEARWVFTRKIDGTTGEAAEYRARWVAKGYRQVEGIDHNEIFASVAHKDTIRVFLATVNYHRLLCDQVDIKAAFLNGDLREIIYLAPAEGSGTSPKYVYRLKKSLYGLKQSPRCFNDKLDA
jgi:hypothetical protein